MFEEMIKIAKHKLDAINEVINGLPAPQVTVLLTNNGNIYISVNDVEGTICEELKSNNNTKVVKMLTMWKDGTIDLPSVKLRKALVNIDEYNNNTDIILQGKDSYLTKKLAEKTDAK